MKVNRNAVTHAGLTLVNAGGLESLTLRQLGDELNVRAATLYWHFQSKEELIDEMATTVLAEGAPLLVPRTSAADWRVWATSFGVGFRKTLLAYRDGARMVAGSRLTDTRFMKTMERIAAKLIGGGFTLRQAVVLLSTIYNYTLSFVMEEQAVFPRRRQRSSQYDIAERNARLDPEEFPLLRRAGPILFDRFDRRYKEGLALVIRGGEIQRAEAVVKRTSRRSFRARRRRVSRRRP
jgi:TetR/AcrR family transcriptional regulator, tetracycline repressor protein